MMVAAAWTGHNITSSDATWVVVLFSHPFLHFKGDVDAVRIFKGGIAVMNEPSFFEESKVLESKDFGSLFVLLLDFDVLARTYGKEKGKNGVLQYSTMQLCQFPFCNFGNDTCGDGLLQLFFGVFVFEGSDLTL
jgi:hypothetical protein